MSLLIWVIELFNIIINIVGATGSFNNASKIDTSLLKEVKDSFSTVGTICIINIFVSLVFCIAITIAYERSAENKERIKNIENYLISKNKGKTKDKENKTDKENDNDDIWLQKNLKPSNDNVIEKDDDTENVPKKDECPVCFAHISPEDKVCPNCGKKLK